MLDHFESLKNILHISPICIDNTVFRLHYKLTYFILMALSILVTLKQYIGDPIHCIVDDIPTTVINSFCWIYSTFTIPNRLTGKVGKDVVQPGVASYKEDVDPRKFHKYYQWVFVALFIQALMFYVPHYLWKVWEGGKIKDLLQDLNNPVITDQTKADKKKLLVDYFYSNLHTHNLYAIKYIICEALNFTNLIIQICFMDFFLDGEFTTYGFEVLFFTDMHPEERVDPMARVFPKVTKCNFHKYGPSGSVQMYDGLCVLPLNVVNEKIYVFLWFWFLILTILTGVALVYRIAAAYRPQLRFFLLRARTRLSPQDEIEKITKICYHGDWFVLYQLSKNIDHLIFKEVIADLVKRFDENVWD